MANPWPGVRTYPETWYPGMITEGNGVPGDPPDYFTQLLYNVFGTSLGNILDVSQGGNQTPTGLTTIWNPPTSGDPSQPTSPATGGLTTSVPGFPTTPRGGLTTYGPPPGRGGPSYTANPPSTGPTYSTIPPSTGPSYSTNPPPPVTGGSTSTSGGAGNNPSSLMGILGGLLTAHGLKTPTPMPNALPGMLQNDQSLVQQMQQMNLSNFFL